MSQRGSEEQQSETRTHQWPPPGGASGSDVCPSQPQNGSNLNAVRTDQEETSVKSITKKIRQASPRDEPQRKASDPKQLATLYPPMLPKNGTEVKGTQKHHLKKQNKQRKIEKQLGQERKSY